MAVAASSDDCCFAVVGNTEKVMALIAMSTLPSVAFLNPHGADSPLAISRWVCDSVVRAPTAYQLNKSPRYCGMIGSKASVPAGIPSSAIRGRNYRASRMLSFIAKKSLSRGSLIKPFQSTVVRGFSK